MFRFILLLVITISLSFASNVFAFAVPSPIGYVTDMSGKMTQEQIVQLNSKIHNIEVSSRNEIAVLVIPSLNNESIEDVTNQVFNTWGVGKKGLDNGVLLVIAINDHKDRIETGRGVGSDLTDLQSHNILNSLRPYLRSNDIAGAVSSAVDQINGTLESRKAQKADPGKGAAFNAPLPVPQADTSSRTNGGCQAAPTTGLGFGWLFMIGAGVLAIGLFLRRLFRVSPEEVREIGEMAPRTPCVTCGRTSVHSHTPMTTYASVPIVTVPQAVAPVIVPVVAPVVPVVEEPPPRRYTPRYDLFDAPGVPSISPDWKPPVTETVADTAIATAAVIAATEELTRDEGSSSYVDDVLPTVISSSSATYNDDSSMGTETGFSGGDSGGGGASSGWDSYPGVTTDDNSYSSSSSNSNDSSSDLISGVSSIVSDIGDLFGGGSSDGTGSSDSW